MLALQMYLIEGESCRRSLLQPFEYKSVEVTAITRIRLERSQDGRVVCCHREHAPGCSSPNPRRRYVRVRVPPTVFQNTPPLGPLVSLATAATTSASAVATSASAREGSGPSHRAWLQLVVAHLLESVIESLALVYCAKVPAARGRGRGRRCRRWSTACVRPRRCCTRRLARTFRPLPKWIRVLEKVGP